MSSRPQRGAGGSGSGSRNRSIISARMSQQSRQMASSRNRGVNRPAVAGPSSGRSRAVIDEQDEQQPSTSSARNAPFYNIDTGRRWNGTSGRDSARSGSTASYYAEGPTHPPHLKGKDIGLWYARQSAGTGATGTSNKKKDKLAKTAFFKDVDKNWKLEINLTNSRQSKIQALLTQLDELKSKDKDVKTKPKTSQFQKDYIQNVRQNQMLTATGAGGSTSVQSPDNNEELQGDRLSKVLLCDINSSLPLNTESESAAATVPLPTENFRDMYLDDILKEEFLVKKRTSNQYNKMLAFRKTLSAYACLDEVVDIILTNQVIVIEGETGCGKTTQVPQFILDRWISDGNGSVCNILCTQPRRISAISVAERVAQERGEQVGGKSIGYSIRLENRTPSRIGGTITYCTTGIVFQMLKTDPFLNNVSHLVVDEIHERDVLGDSLLAIIKDLIIIRPDLKIILMSATINAEQFASYFNNCPIFHIPGFTYPVEEFYLEDALELTKFEFPIKERVFDSGLLPQHRQFPRGYKGNREIRVKEDTAEQRKHTEFIQPYIEYIEETGQYSPSIIKQLLNVESENINLDLVQLLIEHICDTDTKNGAILVFLPGYDRISNLHQKLANSSKFSTDRCLLIPLHSLMPTTNQREVFNPPPAGKRKIVIATNIAETSITIEDIIYVIDCGKIKMTNFDLENNIETLNEEWVSKANATQRKGRAGRTQPGVCFHLYSKYREEMLEDFKKPEVLRKDLGEEILRIKILKYGKAAQFFNRLMDPPSPEALEAAMKSLRQIHALDTEENLTPLGFHLARLPVDPRSGKMILMGALFSCCNPILSIAATLSFKDPFYVPLGKEKEVDKIKKELSRSSKSDHITLLHAIEEYEFAKITNSHQRYCYSHFLSSNTLSLLENLKGQFAQYLKDLGFLKTTNYRDPLVNINSRNIALLKGVICAGLYPNVAKVKVIRKKGGLGGRAFPVAYTEADGRINIHPKSVNSGEGVFESPFIVYHHKMKTSAVFLYDTTMVTPTQLAFFGGELDYIHMHGFGSVGIDGTIRFICKREVYDLIEKLRKELDILLAHKIQYPGPTNWNELSREGALLQAIAELVSAEYKLLMEEQKEEDESSDDGYMFPNPDL